MAVESRCRQHGSRACCIYQALRLCRRFIQSSTPIRRCLMFFPIPEVATPCNPVPGLLYFPPTFAADRGFQNDPSRAWIGFSSVENGAFCIDVEKRADLVLSGISADTPLVNTSHYDSSDVQKWW